MLDTGLKNKVAIVTGANHGMGAAIAKALAREGAKVLINYYRFSAEAYDDLSEEEITSATEPGRTYYIKIRMQTANDVVEAIRNDGGECVAVEADLSDVATIPMLFDEAEKHLGPVDIVVNNASYCMPDSFIPASELEMNPFFLNEFRMHTASAQQIDAHFAINSRAIALMTSELAKRIVVRNSGWGRVINISTDGAYFHPCCVSYGASKLAMEGYTRSAASELGQYGITVNVISPGAVNTGYIPKELEAEIVKTYPMRRTGQPEDIANGVVFFASKQTDWITGQVLSVGGGNKM